MIASIYSNNHPQKNTAWYWYCLLVIALLSALASLFLISGTLRDPTSSLHAMLGSALWTTIGPHIALVNAALLIASSLSYFKGPKRLAVVTLVCVLAATLGSSLIVMRIMSAVDAAGGNITFIQSLLLKPIVGNGPDETAIVQEIEGKTLRAAIYKPPRNTSQAPVLFYIHGGGFMAGSFTETDADLRWFANQGWLVISVQYRLWRAQEPTWDKAPADIACAAAWIQNNAHRYGGDLQRLSLLGDSAGGNLAVNYAYALASNQVQTPCGDKLPQPNAVVVQYPAVDPIAVYEQGFPVKDFEPKMLLSGYLGGDPYALPDRVQTINSYTYLSTKAPSTLVIAPEQDSLIPSWSVYRFAHNARMDGVDIELVRIPFANHAYNQFAENSLGNQARRSITQRYLIQKGLAPR